MEQELMHKLAQLEELIHQERDHARCLRVSKLKTLQVQKGLLIKELLSLSSDSSPELQPIAGRIRQENLRNVQLLYTTLGYLREAMRDCTRQLMPAAYGNNGHQLQTTLPGLLLAGRI